jgi:SAM-dependent methyltransferase
MPEISYVGSELEIFAHASNWKNYVRSQIEEYLTGSVLEVGAGIGSNTLAHLPGPHKRWVCLEPDSQLAACIRRNPALTSCQVIVGTIADLSAAERFDAVLYMDVLEHIADDAVELRRSAEHLTPGGRLIVIAPAHEWLFSPFDHAIGHYRRYNAATLRDIGPPGMPLEVLRYLDAAGMCASLGNRLFLSSAAPTIGQIRAWDRFFVPLSRKIDSLLAYKIGRSVMAVWKSASDV